jgi:uncharacterized protein YggE
MLPSSSLLGSSLGEEIRMLFILSAAAFVAAQRTPATEPNAPPRIVVEGVGSVKSKPNVATISYDVKGEGRTSDQAISALVATSAAVENALRSMDPALDLHSDTVKVQAVRGQSCKAEDDDIAQLSSGPCAVAGYVATQDFDVRTTHVTDAGTMVGLAGRAGASSPSIDDFDLADNRDARRQAIAAALSDALTKAQAIASGSNAKVGELLAVSMDDARSADIVVTGTLNRNPNLVVSAPIVVTVSPSPVVTTARLTVTYAIAR